MIWRVKFSETAKRQLNKLGKQTQRDILKYHVMEAVKKDYKAMRNMIYGTYSSYDAIQQVLKELENEINSLTR